MPRLGRLGHRLQIGDRDRWICGICDKPIDWRLSVYDSEQAATIDHIVPKFWGGTHEDSNLQIAHYECNRLKGKMSRSEIYALLGDNSEIISDNGELS